MDITQLEPELLEKILLSQETCKPEFVSAIAEWNSNMEPSIGMTKRRIETFLIVQQENGKKDFSKLKKSASQCVQILNQLLIGRCPRNFMRAYLAVIKENFSQIQGTIDKQYIRKTWMTLSVEILESYMSTFSLNEILTQEEYNQKFNDLLQKKQFVVCKEFLKITGIRKNLVQVNVHVMKALLTKMTTNKDSSKAADFIKQLKLNPKDFPAIGQRLYKNTARHFLSYNGWEYAEEIFQQHPEALASVVQDLIYKKKINEALSIILRHDVKKYIQKADALQIISKFQKNELKPQIIENFLYKDTFGPSNPQKQFSLIQFGFSEQDVIWVDDDHPELQQIMKDITQSELIGVDTESIVGQTKFQKNKIESAILIQIATQKKIYLFDGFKSDSEKIRTNLLKILQGDSKIIGHSLSNDIDILYNSFKFEKKPSITNVVDIWKLFKHLFPKQKYSSLAHICKSILGKQLCKAQTLTNWKRRPLRKNQLHYAALDALIVIKVYEKLTENYGQIVKCFLQLQNEEQL